VIHCTLHPRPSNHVLSGEEALSCVAYLEMPRVGALLERWRLTGGLRSDLKWRGEHYSYVDTPHESGVAYER
jgi:hypothetical protein